MKIGILTFHCAHNYGAVLQAYALQTYLLSQGHDAYVIDYRPHYLTDVYKVFNYRRWVSKNPLKFAYHTLREIRFLPTRHKRHDAFDRFISTRLRLYPYRQPDDLKAFGLVLLGSDQIWNKGITGGRYDDLLWGQTIPVAAASYAASMRWKRLDTSDRDYISQALERLAGSSVRESKLQKLLAAITPKPVHLVLDPTLLLQTSDYEALLSDVQTPESPYVLLYQVEQHADVGEVARSVARSLHCPVHELGAYANARKTRGCRMLRSASPEAFLAHIKNAACVVTSSFHGTALSVVFRKSFYTVRLDNEIDERSTSLLHALDLENRLVGCWERPGFMPVDYSHIAGKAARLKEASTEFLEKVIDNVQDR